MNKNNNLISSRLSANNQEQNHLPLNTQERELLKQLISQYVTQLEQNSEQNKGQIELLNLRKRLISSCQQLSLQRIDNFENIFLHYCTHIFKTGKHMTFDRLEYEKTHLTMDRFFVFLKDFGLMTAKIDGEEKDIIEKIQIVKIFKKYSDSSKDLSFENFITCLEKMSLLYFLCKDNYKRKKEKINEDRIKRREVYLKKMKKRSELKKKLEIALGKDKIQDEEEKEDQQEAQEEENEEDIQDKKTQKEIKVETKPLKQQKKEEDEQKQNDKLLQEMMQKNNLQGEDKEEGKQQDQNDIQDKGEELEPPKQQDLKQDKEIYNKDLLILTQQEKIQYFYQKINVDNAAAYKKKMRQLNLPVFQNQTRKSTKTRKYDRNKSHSEIVSQSQKQTKLQQKIKQSDNDRKRLESLRQKFEERKERDKNNSPQLNRDDYEKRIKRQKMLEQESVLVPRKEPRKKKVEIEQMETDLNSISKMAYQNINFRRFNPTKLFGVSEDDSFLEEYSSIKKPKKKLLKSEKSIFTNLSNSDKNSQLMYDKIRKRANQIEIKQRNEQSKYDFNVEGNHRRNKLVHKLMQNAIK